MLEDYEEYVTLFERVKDNIFKEIRTWYINLDSSGNNHLDTNFKYIRKLENSNEPRN